MESQPVFFDPQGKRRVRVSRFAAIISLLIAVFTTVAVISIAFVVPTLPGGPARRGGKWLPDFRNPKVKRHYILGRPKRELMAIANKKEKVTSPPVRTPQVVIGFYTTYQETATASLRSCASSLTHVMPEWLHLSASGTELDYRDFDFDEHPDNQGVVKIARANGLKIVPLINNGSEGQFSESRVHALLRSQKDQQRLAEELTDWLVENKFQGLNVDFEQLSSDDARRLPGFLKLLRAYFDPHNLELSADLELSLDPAGMKAITAACDYVVMMVYDEHDEGSEPGPIASIDWCQSELDRVAKTVPADKLVLGIGNYAYDWTLGKHGAESLTYQEAVAAARTYRDNNEPPGSVIQLDPDSLNNRFGYFDDDNKKHIVWMVDAISAYNQWRSAIDYSLRGAAVWDLGSEDPGIWKFLKKGNLQSIPGPECLKTIHFPFMVDRQGKGEILKVVAKPKDGSRIVQHDEDGLIVKSAYVEYPLAIVIDQSGFSKDKLALTFDDGPDKTYTPQILDVLKQQAVPATFFVIGKEAETYPGLVKRMYDEGHEVGNHTFLHPDMGAVSETRAKLEINATQRAIEGILGRSTVLFRAPYNADSEPQSLAEVLPLITASELGYVTVGEKIDPQDWNAEVPLKSGGHRIKTSKDIVGEVLQQITQQRGSNEEGNIILLHDAGGPRETTVKALEYLIPYLKARGYKFVTVSNLMNTTRDQVMPQISTRERFLILADRLVFTIVFSGEAFLAFAFTLAIGLGVLRIVSITPLAIIQARKTNHFIGPSDYKPSVSALIAAFNEERVIARTIASVLASDYPVMEVIVVDDGSMDETARVVCESFGENPRVRLVQQQNAGKATALNRALQESSGEILFCIDADTQLDRLAVSKLVRHFHDPEVGAVAGNVKVGNVMNILTRWQSVEYTTSQNLDRRAYALLNAITVVPGAIGAWRKQAVIEVGGHISDTLAEDMDLTWRLRQAGYRCENEAEAHAYTEAPETFSAFFRQRFRWAYGTLQCLFKHRRALFHHGWFGWVALPTLWLFQIIFQAIAPLVDLTILIAGAGFLMSYFGNRGQENSDLLNATNSLYQIGFLYAMFFLLELIAGFVAYRLDREKPTALWWLFLQRFAYRQIMYGVVYKSLIKALRGSRQGWGKLDRKGSVNVPKPVI